MFYNYLIFSIVALSLHIFQKYLVSSIETTCFILLELLVSHGGNKEFHQTGSFVPLKNEEDKEYSFREHDDKR